MANVESLSGSINKLPNEILEKLFQYLPTSDALRSCRLVSKNWKNIATFICRKRHVKLMYTKEFELRFEGDFMRDDLPWSAVRVELYQYPDDRTGQICEGFGTELQVLDVVIIPSQLNGFVTALRRMPNLEQLTIMIFGSGPAITDSDTLVTFPSHDRFLQKLKRIYISHDCNDQFFDFMEVILKTGAPLTHLSIDWLNEEVPANKFRKLLDMIRGSNIPNVSLSLEYSSVLDQSLMALEYQQIVGIHEIFIVMSRHGGGVHDFRALGTFLTNCTCLQGLRFLEFGFDSPGYPLPASKLLMFTRLNSLKSLKISLAKELYNEEADPDHERPLIWFQPLKTTDFPNLETMDFDLTSSWYCDKLSIDIGKMFDLESGPFKSVKYLNVGNFEGGNGRLAPLFPNTIKIGAMIENSGQLPSIFEGMNNVTEVDLTLNSNLDNNVLFFEAFGFIRCLERLEKLVVRNRTNGSGIAVGDTGLIVLTLLHPVNLTIYNAEVKETDGCVTLIRTVHPQLQLLRYKELH